MDGDKPNREFTPLEVSLRRELSRLREKVTDAQYTAQRSIERELEVQKQFRQAREALDMIAINAKKLLFFQRQYEQDASAKNYDKVFRAFDQLEKIMKEYGK